MRKAKETFRKILRKIYIGLGLTVVAMVFQACYGTPESIGLDTIRGTVKSNKTKEPIKGIKVSVENMDQDGYTDDSGKFKLYVPQEESYTVLFEDIDGPANGGEFSTKKQTVNLSKKEMDLGDILLDAK